MRAWNGCRKSRLLSRKQTVSDRRRRMRRACALGRKPSRRIAFSTRARVSRLTCELEFSTREIVPIPTLAALATSRIVVLPGTASILCLLVACGVWLGLPRPFLSGSSLPRQFHEYTERRGQLYTYRHAIGLAKL